MIRQAYAELSPSTRHTVSLDEVLASRSLRRLLMLKHEARHARKGARAA